MILKRGRLNKKGKFVKLKGFVLKPSFLIFSSPRAGQSYAERDVVCAAP